MVTLQTAEGRTGDAAKRATICHSALTTPSPRELWTPGTSTPPVSMPCMLSAEMLAATRRPVWHWYVGQFPQHLFASITASRSCSRSFRWMRGASAKAPVAGKDAGVRDREVGAWTRALQQWHSGRLGRR